MMVICIATAVGQLVIILLVIANQATKTVLEFQNGQFKNRKEVIGVPALFLTGIHLFRKK